MSLWKPDAKRPLLLKRQEIIYKKYLISSNVAARSAKIKIHGMLNQLDTHTHAHAHKRKLHSIQVNTLNLILCHGHVRACACVCVPVCVCVCVCE